MAREKRRREPEPVPPPLPPATRTVGQLVAETIRLYGSRFWPALALGIAPAAAGLALAEAPRAGRGGGRPGARGCRLLCPGRGRPRASRSRLRPESSPENGYRVG